MNKFGHILFGLLLLVGCAKDSVVDGSKGDTDEDNDGGTAVVSWPSPAGDVVGKITVGYQGWFACLGDGSPINGWWHWSKDWSKNPAPANAGFSSWPDMKEYTHKYTTGFSSLKSGVLATLFSSYDDQSVDIHFSWMKKYGIDVAALQRFNPNGIEGPIRDSIIAKVKKAGEKYGVRFYIMYDVSGWTNMQSEIKADWTNKMKTYTASSAYAIQNNKPVVCIWGFGFNDENHAFSADQCMDVINWFKQQGCYVIGGVPTHWLLGSQDSRANFLDVYKDFNMLSPWMIGRIGSIADEDNFYANVNTPDLAYCKGNGIDYQPCLLPGDLQASQRIHGDFMWEQFYNMTKLKVQGLYVSMFDEFNENNQIAKTAATQEEVPVGSGFKSLDEDGTACSSDYYLRLTGDGGKMFKGELPLTAIRPTIPEN